MTTPLPTGATCAHPNMTECCEGCGHYSCPDCGLAWDDHSEGYFCEEDTPNEPTPSDCR
jgi:hypothetical protein